MERFWALYETHPDFIKQVRQINDVCWWHKRYPLYFSICERVVEAFPDHPLSVGMLADEVIGYVILREPDKAAATLDAFWAKYSTAPDFLDKIAQIKDNCWWHENDALHFAICERVAGAFPDDPQTIQVRADEIMGYLKRNEPSLADEKLALFLADYGSDPGLAGHLNVIAGLYNETGDTDTALSLVDAIFEQNSESPDNLLFGYTTLARVYVHQDKDAEAEAAVNEAINLFADDPNALAFHLFAVGEEYYLRAQAKESDTTIPEEVIQKDYLTAIHTWDTLMQSWPQTIQVAESCFHAAESGRAMGNGDIALNYYSQLLDLNPNHKMAWHAHFMIADMLENLFSFSGDSAPSPDEMKAEIIYHCYRVIEDWPDCPAAKAAQGMYDRYTEESGEKEADHE